MLPLSNFTWKASVSCEAVRSTPCDWITVSGPPLLETDSVRNCPFLAAVVSNIHTFALQPSPALLPTAVEIMMLLSVPPVSEVPGDDD